jgi:hypothetical protein
LLTTSLKGFNNEKNKQYKNKRKLSPSNCSAFLTPTKMRRYISGEPTPFNVPNKAVYPETVPSLLVFGNKYGDDEGSATSPVYEPVYRNEEAQKAEEEEDSYVPSTGSKTLLSYSSQDLDEISTIMPSERDPSETQASAVKAYLHEDETTTEDGMKCKGCRCTPCIWIQKGHLVQKTHQQAVRRACWEADESTLPNWHLRRLYFAEMSIQMWGPLGWERKTMIPNCVVECVRGLFPEPTGIYNYPRWS